MDERVIWRQHAAGRLGVMATVRALQAERLRPWWERWRWRMVAGVVVVWGVLAVLAVVVWRMR